MPELPVVVTQEDATNPNLLFRLLKNLAEKISQLGNKLEAVKSSIKAFSFKDIRNALQAGGSTPLNVTSLRGVLADPQPAAALRYTSVPAGQILQGLRNTQLITVGTTSAGYDLYTVIGGNPNTLYKLIGGAAGGNMMTTDTAQNVTGTKTFKIVQVFDNTILLNWIDSAGTGRSVIWMDNTNPDIVHLRNNQRGNGGTISFETKSGGVQAAFLDSAGKWTALFAQRWNGTEASNTSPYTILGTGFWIGILPAAAFTVNMPASPLVGDVYVINDANGSAAANNITVQGNGHNIDGAASAVINTNWGVLRVFYTGAIWKTW